MKKYVYILRDKKLGAYENPILRVDDVEHVVESYVRGLKLISPEEAVRARDMSLYYLGTFDDVIGKFELIEHEEKLLDFEDYIPRKEEAKDGGQSN